MNTALIRDVRFVARHRYRLSDLTDGENRRVFGAQTESHQHAWRVRVEIRGPGDPRTGFVTDLGSLDDALDGILGPWKDADLNESIPEVRTGRMQPSTEALARWVYDRLAGRIGPPATLAYVEVWESDALGARFPA